MTLELLDFQCCYRRVMPRYPPENRIVEVIELEPGQVSPEGANWVNIGPLMGGCWYLDGNIPTPPGRMSIYGEYPGTWEATEAAIKFASEQGVQVLYVEFDARRC